MGRLLGIDYGLKRVGLAVTDSLQIIASPFDVYPNNTELIPRLISLCNEYQIEKIVLGYPNSNEHQEAQEMVKKFAERLKQEIKIPIDYQDESLSTVYAQAFLKATGQNNARMREKIDKFAAQKILEDYIRQEQD